MLKDGRLQFGEKPKMQVDTDPLKVEEALYLEPLDCMMVGTNESYDLKMEEGAWVAAVMYSS